MKLRVLLIAPHADGSDVGEAWSTYQWVKRISEVCDCTVLTCSKPLQAPLAPQIPLARVVQWFDPAVPKFAARFVSMAKPFYPFFSARCTSWIRSAIARGERWDLIHQVAPLGIRYGTPARHFDIPYVIGPLAGSLSTPGAFLGDVSSSAWYTRLRSIDPLRMRFDWTLRGSFSKSSMILGVAPYVSEVIPTELVQSFEVMNETGIVSLPEKQATPGSSAGPIRLLYVGRIVPAKGLRYLLDALPRVTLPIHLTVIGDGEDRAYCERIVGLRGLSNIVTFLGKIPRDDVNTHYTNSDLFILPSLREPSGNVVLEAMSFGLPLVVANRGGPGFTVKDGFGVRVEPDNPDNYSVSLANAINAIAADKNRLAEMGRSARIAAHKDHLWDAKIARLMSIYDRVLGQN